MADWDGGSVDIGESTGCSLDIPIREGRAVAILVETLSQDKTVSYNLSKIKGVNVEGVVNKCHHFLTESRLRSDHHLAAENLVKAPEAYCASLCDFDQNRISHIWRVGIIWKVGIRV